MACTLVPVDIQKIITASHNALDSIDMEIENTKRDALKKLMEPYRFLWIKKQRTESEAKEILEILKKDFYSEFWRYDNTYYLYKRRCKANDLMRACEICSGSMVSVILLSIDDAVFVNKWLSHGYL